MISENKNKTMNEVEFNRQIENLILTLIKGNNNVNVEENYVICDGERKIKVSIKLKEE
jgi:hypothetical protein